MNENLTNFLSALNTYLTLETKENKKNHITNIPIKDREEVLLIKNYSPITNERALKLRNNIKSHKELYKYHKEFELRKDVILEILSNFKNEKKLVWDIIEMDGSINFLLGTEDTKQRWLALDVDQLLEITSDKLEKYKKGFENNIAPILNRNFSGNNFSKTNTRTVYINNDDSFKDLCRIGLIDNNKLYVETCIISFDIDDLITGVSPYNYYNRNQFSFFEKVTDDNSNIIFASTTKDHNEDVNPTRPPY